MSNIKFLGHRLTRLALVMLLATSLQGCIVYTFDGNNLKRVPAGQFACEIARGDHASVACQG